MLIPKKKVIDRLGCLTILLQIEVRSVERRDKTWSNIHTFGFEEGRSATKISTAIRVIAAAAREWGPELGIIVCSLVVKQVFDNVSLLNLSLVMNEVEIAPVLAWNNIDGAN